MLADTIRARLSNIASLPQGVLHFVDYTRGETSAAYVIIGDKSNFQDIEAFAASAIVDVARHMQGDIEPRATWATVDWVTLDAIPAEPPAWASASYNRILLPGERNCLPSSTVLGFEPPGPLIQRIYLQPDLSGTEDCVICESKGHYVLGYWHTTG